jgi:glycosyltransferase involved in cell wall biosynthesis
LLISVVIATYNRCDKLRLALEGLEKQSLDEDKFEVWVIDNNSSDDTQGTVKDFQDRLNLHYYLEKEQGLGHARDAGFREARGEYVAFLDDDAIPTPDWLSNIHRNIQEHEPDCICGPIVPYYTSEKPHWFKDEYEVRALGGAWHIVPAGTTHSGSNMTWKRSVLFDLGGFNVSLGVSGDTFIAGEDTDLFNRYWKTIRGKIVYDPKVEVLHWTPDYKMRVSYVLKRFLAVGVITAKLNRPVSFFKKIFRTLQLVFEIIASLFIFPFTIFRHRYLENWIIEEGRRVVVRVGELITMIGIEPHIRQK